MWGAGSSCSQGTQGGQAWKCCPLALLRAHRQQQEQAGPAPSPWLLVLTKGAVALPQLLRMLQAGQVVHSWPKVSFPALLFTCFLPRPFCVSTALHKGATALSWAVARPALEGSRELVLLSCKPALAEQNREGGQSWRVQLRRNAAECSTESQEAADGHQQMRVTHSSL